MVDSAVNEAIRARIDSLVSEPVDNEYWLKPVREGVAEECFRFLIALKLSDPPALFRTARGKLRAEWNTVYSIQSITFRGGTKEASTYALHFPLDDELARGVELQKKKNLKESEW